MNVLLIGGPRDRRRLRVPHGLLAPDLPVSLLHEDDIGCSRPCVYRYDPDGTELLRELDMIDDGTFLFRFRPH